MNFINDNEILKPIGSSKLIRHPRWDFSAPVNSTGRGVPPSASTGLLQLLCQCFNPKKKIRPTSGNANQELANTITNKSMKSYLFKFLSYIENIIYVLTGIQMMNKMRPLTCRQSFVR